ncbi:MAG: DNA repair protein RadC [Acidaminococcaceae bacterium]|jgi:DNA repair protein RadC
MRIKDLPASERPREKAFRYGFETLSNVELLAIIIGSGVKNYGALDIAARLIAKVNGLYNLRSASLEKIKEVEGINHISALRLGAVFHLLNRMEKSRIDDNKGPISSQDIFYKYKEYFRIETQEQFILLMMSKNGEIISEKKMYKGTSEYFPVSIREIISELLSAKCFRFIVVHNHPSGEIVPSDNDLIATKVLCDEASRLRIELCDHIIIGKEKYYSFVEHNLIKMREK